MDSTAPTHLRLARYTSSKFALRPLILRRDDQETQYGRLNRIKLPKNARIMTQLRIAMLV
jgi:hypothetical protein